MGGCSSSTLTGSSDLTGIWNAGRVRCPALGKQTQTKVAQAQALIRFTLSDREAWPHSAPGRRERHPDRRPRRGRQGRHPAGPQGMATAGPTPTNGPSQDEDPRMVPRPPVDFALMATLRRSITS
jgi:hypothetical protein